MDQPLDQPMPDQSPPLNEDQVARMFVLAMVKPLLTAQGLASKTPPDVRDLIALATWVISGDKEPLFPYTDDDGTVHLGVGIWLKPDGYLWVKGMLYEPTEEDT